MEKEHEDIIQARDIMGFFENHIRDAHATTDNKLLEILLYDILTKIVPVRDLINVLVSSFED